MTTNQPTDQERTDTVDKELRTLRGHMAAHFAGEVEEASGPLHAAADGIADGDLTADEVLEAYRASLRVLEEYGDVLLATADDLDDETADLLRATVDAAAHTLTLADHHHHGKAFTASRAEAAEWAVGELSTEVDRVAALVEEDDAPRRRGDETVEEADP